jgi:hypothetical protein
MTDHAILIPNAVAALNIDSWTRTAYCASDVDNGNLVILTGKESATGTRSEAWTAVVPSTGNGITDVWMAYDPTVSWTGSYRGLTPDMRQVYNPTAGGVFSIFKPQISDIFTLTEAGISGSVGANTFLNCTNTGGFKPAWAATIGSSQFAAKLLAVTYVTLSAGTLGDTQHLLAYQFEVVAL